MDKNFSITVHFESYDDLLLLSKWLKNTDVNRKSRAKGFRGEEDWDSFRQRRQELYTAVEESLN